MVLPEQNHVKWQILYANRRGALGFSVFRFRPLFRPVFRFLCLLRFRVFPYFSIWFSVFGQNTSDFLDLVSNEVFGFACLVSGLWFPQPRAPSAGAKHRRHD